MENTSNSTDFDSTEAGSLSQLIAEFKSSLESRNINLRGKLTFTLGGSAQVDVQFQPPPLEDGTSTEHQHSSSNRHYKQMQSQSLSFNDQLLLPQTRSLNQVVSSTQISSFETTSCEPKTSSSQVQGVTQAPFVSRNFSPPSTYNSVLFSQTAPSSSTLGGADNSQEFHEDYRFLSMTPSAEISKSTFQSPHCSFTSTELPDKLFSDVEISDIEQFRFKHSTSTLPPFEKIIQQKYPQTSSHHRVTSIGSNEIQATGNNYACIPETAETNYSQSIYQSLGLCNSYLQANTSKHDFLPSNNSFTLSDGNFLLNKVSDQRVRDTCDKLEGSSHLSPSSKEQDNASTKAFEAKNDFRVSPDINEGKTFAENVKSLKHQNPSTCSSTLKATESCGIQTLQSLKQDDINPQELENLSHKVLVVMLTQVLAGREVTEMKSSSSYVATSSRNNTAQQRSEESIFEIAADETHLKTGAGDVKTSMHETSVDQKTSDSCAAVPEEDDLGDKHIRAPRKSQRKRKRPLKILGYEDPNPKKDIPVGHCKPGSNNLSHNKTHPLGKKTMVTSQTAKSKATNTTLKSNTGAQAMSNRQPLKKRTRLRSNVNENNCSKDKQEGDESDTQKVNPAMHENTRTSNCEKAKSDEVKRKGKASSFTCKLCTKVFSDKLMYRKHVRSHGGGYQCDVCGKTLKTKDSLYHHQRGLHTKVKPYVCKLCNATFSFHHSFKLHVQRHKGERPHRCTVCQKTYLTSNHLKVHIEAAHEFGSIVCHICGKTFSYNCTLKQHLRTHSGERPFSCWICDKSFTTKQSLEAHTATHNENKNYPCGICGKRYKSERSKNVHMTQHGKQVRKFICELCGKSFYSKSTLKAHIYTHGKARPFTCTVCGKGFKTKASLYTHNYVHRKSQPFACTVCGKTFKTKNCCSAHMKRHENEMSFTCYQCGSTFPDKGGLSKHIKTIHIPKKQFTCTICGKKGTRGDNMRTHVKSHKREEIALNPMHFIKEEAVSGIEAAQGFVQARPRLRGPRQRSSRRLCVKDSPLGSKEIIPPINNTTVTIVGQKPETEACTSLHPTLMNLPCVRPKQCNPQKTFFTSETNSHQNNIHSSLADLPQEQQHSDPQQQHPSQQYQQENSKLPYYLIYMPPQSNVSGMTSNSPHTFGPMTSLLSAINPTSEQESLSGNSSSTAASVYHSALPSLHTPHPMECGNQQMVSSFYADPLPMHGSLSQLHQILTRPNEGVLNDPHRAVAQGQNELQF